MSRTAQSVLGNCKQTGKQCLRSQDDAERLLGRLRRSRSRRGHMETRAYACSHCSWWHLTSRSALADGESPVGHHPQPSGSLLTDLARSFQGEISAALARPTAPATATPGTLAQHLNRHRAHQPQPS